VTIFVRNVSKLPVALASHPRLRTFTGELHEADKMARARRGLIVDRQIISTNFADNKIGVSPVRRMVIYLPLGFESTRRYPVIHFLPNPFEDSYRFDFDHRDAQGLFRSRGNFFLDIPFYRTH
jgi:hypothetical protein